MNRPPSARRARRHLPRRRSGVRRAAGLLVTGTDTGVGKTLVACALVAAWRRLGVEVAVLKPAESGCASDRAGKLVPRDALRLREAAGAVALPLDAVCPYAFSAPLAPAAAANACGTTVSLRILDRVYRKAARRAEVVVVEGAGGLLVPLARAGGRAITYVELAQRWKLAVLVVAPARLGVINHAALTVATARAAGLPVLGVVLNSPVSHIDPSSASNPRWIEAVAGSRVLGAVPFLRRAGALPPSRLATHVARAIDCSELLVRLLRSAGRSSSRNPTGSVRGRGRVAAGGHHRAPAAGH